MSDPARMGATYWWRASTVLIRTSFQQSSFRATWRCGICPGRGLQVASLPLQENVPIGGVPTGPRDIDWHPNKPGTLVWVEALDDADPKKQVKDGTK